MVRPKPKKVGNPNNQTVAAFRGVSAEVLRAKKLASKVPAGQADRVVSYDPAAVRASIEAQVCPFCGGGPYRVVALHTNHIHGIDAAELRRLAGVSGRTVICSPESSRARSSRARPPEEIERLKRVASTAMERRRAALREEHAKWATEFKDLGGGYEAVKELAQRHGITKDNMRRHLLAAGCDVPKGSNPVPNPRGTSLRRIPDEERQRIIEAHGRGLSQQRIADMLGASRKRVRRVLRQAGLAR